MNPTFDAFLRSWPFEPWVLASLLLTAGIYLRGWLALHRRDERRWPWSQPVAFGAGLLALFLALASPIEPFTSLLLQVHMLQHVLLMMIAPPLLWLGAPLFPLLLGLPRPIRTYWAAPLFAGPFLRRSFEMLTHPVPAWLLFTAATWFWHLPPIYELALASDGWHYLQHVCFLGTALLFWYPVIRPYPSRPSWSPWLLIPYLILADVQNTLLSAVLTFSDQPLYPYYVERPRLGNLSPLDDQAAAGVLMWVPGSLAYLVPLFVIGIRLLFGGSETSRRRPDRSQDEPRPGHLTGSICPAHRRPARPRVEPAAFDLLRVPLLGRFLRWRHARLSLQVPLLLLAGLIVYDGFRGPQIGAMNLAGVLPWIHWRGLVVLGLLAAGNVSCMACPFMVPRTLARRWLPQGRSWPRRLRNKWLAVILLVGLPVGLRGVRSLGQPMVDRLDRPGLLRGRLRDRRLLSRCVLLQVCLPDRSIQLRPIAHLALWKSRCATRAPVRRARPRTVSVGRDDIPGCELHLFQPRKSSNMDCTFCLDCIHACPDDNVGILAGRPGKSCGTIPFARASAGSASAPTWRPSSWC